MATAKALVISVAWALAQTAAFAGSEARSLSVDGISRSYRVFVPSAVSRRPLPAVFVLHGGQGEAAQTERYTGMSKAADRNGFVAVYPNGLKRRWNDGRDASDTPKVGGKPVDDVAFLVTLADRLAEEGLVDPKAVFLTGISNGAMLSLLAGCRRPDRFRAIAPISGSLPAGAVCDAKLPLPAVIFHGTADEYIPYAGGPVAAIRGRPPKGYVQSADATVAAIAKVNGCAPPQDPPVWIDADKTDETRVRIDNFRCPKDAPLRHVVIEGGGHSWPGNGQQFVADWILGRSTREIDANQMMLEFFRALPPR